MCSDGLELDASIREISNERKILEEKKRKFRFESSEIRNSKKKKIRIRSNHLTFCLESFFFFFFQTSETKKEIDSLAKMIHYFVIQKKSLIHELAIRSIPSLGGGQQVRDLTDLTIESLTR